MTQTNNDLIIAFDPGGTTGYVCHHLRHLGLPRISGGNYDYIGAWTGGQMGPEIHRKQLWAFLCKENPTAIVCEDFDYRILRDKDDTYDRGGISLVSRDYIGVIGLYCDLTATPLYMQNPDNVLSVKWLDDDALKKLGVYVKGKENRHQNDAARHMIYYLVNTLKRKDALNALRQRSGAS